MNRPFPSVFTAAVGAATASLLCGLSAAGWPEATLRSSYGAPGSAQAAAPLAAPSSRVEGAPVDRSLLDKYCVTCHNGRLKAAGLQLDVLEPGPVIEAAETWEKVVRKLRTDAMPPAGSRRPTPIERERFVSSLEHLLDLEADTHPNPGRPTIHRLNRSEYANAIRDLFDLDIDARSLLPGDNSNAHGFDNDADVLSVSPVLLERYLAAARKISRVVVGRPVAPDLFQQRIHKWNWQDDRMSDDLPFGSRGGAAVPYFFPVDGDYTVKVDLHRTGNDHIQGLGAPHQLDIRLDGTLIKRFVVGGDEWVKRAPPENYSSNLKMDPEWEDYSHNMDRDLEVKIPVKAGRRVVGVSFVSERWLPEGIVQPQVGVSRDRNELPDGNPSVASVIISGPFTVTAAGDPPNRRKVFTCIPAKPADEEPCARQILSTLARRAYRRPVMDADLQPLLTFYRKGREETDFVGGVQSALERLLTSPQFLFRVEEEGPSGGIHRITDLELASRLSFFLWSSIPDESLLSAALAGQLKTPGGIDAQVRRMVTDPRARALVDNFAGQWLVIRNLRDVIPDADLFPDFDEKLRAAFQRETELFLDSMIREDHGLLDLITADYTFVNERLARHYNIAGVYGEQFRRVTLPTAQRAGLLGQGSILTVTSYPNRTSPVLRGKYLLENFFGAPPPAPPPGVPPLPENGSTGAMTSVRARLEQHRENAVCASCHARMDPLGFALENYDAVGSWRTSDEWRTPVDAVAALPDGTRIDGPAGLRKVLLDRRQQFVQTVAEKLLSYALGRELDYYDAPAIRKIVRNAEAHEYRWSAIIRGIVESVPFQMRRALS
jgi:hypothetical protein